MEARAPTVLAEDRDLYPIHEEDDVSEIPFHERQTRYVRDALSARLPQFYVTGNVCVYWEPGNHQLYRAPDVLVAQGPPAHPQPRVYLVWEDPPILFAAEIGSRSTFREGEGPKLEIYRDHLRAAEYLYSNPPEDDLRMWRLGGSGYEPVQPEASGRLRSVELDLEFGIENGFLRVYAPDGERLRTHEESEADRQAAEARAQEALARAQEALARAQEAQARAAEEQARREDLERRFAELEAKVQQGRAEGTEG